jgi:hypothetical protein
MLTQAERLLLLDSNVTGSLLPAIFKIFSQWRLTDAQQMILSPCTDRIIMRL